MSTNTISVKRHNHRVHPCTHERKQELLKLLLEKNADKSILIATAKHLDLLKDLANENITVSNDSELLTSNKEKYNTLISYDLPNTAIEYMARVAHATEQALILLDNDEHKLLYPIETLMGRALMQENISGFETLSSTPLKKEYKPRTENAKSDFKKEYKPRSDGGKPEYKKDFKKDENNSWKKPDFSKSKEKPASKFLGKDENGKAIFSGKSRERNHRHDGSPKADSEKVSTRRRTGRKINIKAIKPKKDEE